MTRLRYTYDEARAKAEVHAKAFAATQEWGHLARCDGARPYWGSQGKSSKHPTVWNVVFRFFPPDFTLDGGELFVLVDLETEVVSC